MDIYCAIILAGIFFPLSYLIAHFLADISRISSLVLAFLITVLLLLIIYPPYRLPNDSLDASMWIYMAFIFFAILIFLIYLLCYTLTDTEERNFSY